MTIEYNFLFQIEKKIQKGRGPFFNQDSSAASKSNAVYIGLNKLTMTDASR